MDALRRKQFGICQNDEDVLWFFNTFTERPPGRVLEVGAHDESIAYVLAELGFDVVGVDLREYDRFHGLHARQRHVVGDFNQMSFKEEFDVAVSTSAIEHFGLNTYREGIFNDDYDVDAVGNVWTALKPDGLFYVTVPFGSTFHVQKPDWRIYDSVSLRARIIQDFTVEAKDYFASAPAGRYQLGDDLTEREAMEYGDLRHPHITVGLKLRKHLGGNHEKASKPLYR